MESRRIRLVVVIPGEATGASMIFIKRQVESLAGYGVDADVFFLASRVNPVRILAEHKRLKERIEAFRPDLLHAQYGTMTGLVAALTGFPAMVLSVRGSDLNDSPQISWLHNKLSHFMTRIAAWRARRIFCVSPELKARLPRYSEKTVVIPTGVDLSLFEVMDRTASRTKLAWARNAKIVLFNQGGRQRGKGRHRAVDAVAIARKSLGEIEMKVMDGQIPPVEVPTWINAADCVLLASDAEGSPNIVKEAMACNVPVVATRVGDVQHRLRGVEPSEVCDCTAESLGKGLVSVLSDPRSRSNGRGAVQCVSQDAIARLIVENYSAVVQGRPSL